MALTGKITVTTEQLSAKSGAVKGELNQLKSNFDNLKNLIDGTSSYWTGSAADKHRSFYAKKISSIDEMFRRYQEHIVDLEKMAGIYQQAEAAATNAADELPASMLD